MAAIIVNGEQFQAEGQWVSYDMICDLAGISPDQGPTVIYRVAGNGGSLRPGEVKPLVPGSVYNVGLTNKA